VYLNKCEVQGARYNNERLKYLSKTATPFHPYPDEATPVQPFGCGVLSKGLPRGGGDRRTQFRPGYMEGFNIFVRISERKYIINFTMKDTKSFIPDLKELGGLVLGFLPWMLSLFFRSHPA